MLDKKLFKRKVPTLVGAQFTGDIEETFDLITWALDLVASELIQSDISFFYQPRSGMIEASLLVTKSDNESEIVIARLRPTDWIVIDQHGGVQKYTNAQIEEYFDEVTSG